MKSYGILSFVMAVAIPSLATAELPFSRQGLGQVEATFNFCSQIKPDSAEKFKAYAKRLVRGLPSGELEKARKSEEYQKAYEWLTKELGKADKDQAKQACSDFLEAKE